MCSSGWSIKKWINRKANDLNIAAVNKKTEWVEQRFGRIHVIQNQSKIRKIIKRRRWKIKIILGLLELYMYWVLNNIIKCIQLSQVF